MGVLVSEWFDNASKQTQLWLEGIVLVFFSGLHKSSLEVGGFIKASKKHFWSSIKYLSEQK